LNMTIINQRGSVLLFVVSGIAMVAAIAMGMFYMTSTSSLGQAVGSGINRAHYLALAGKDYAIANWNNRSQLTGNEFTVSNTERFSLLITDSQITSTGIVNKDTSFEARKTIKSPPPSPASASKQFFDPFADLSKWATSTQVGGHAIVTVSGDSALKVTATQTNIFGARPWSFIQLNTGSSGANVDLTTAWTNAGYCLSYDLQVKISNSQPFHMEGLTFKVSSSGDTFYGVSYIRRKQRRSFGSWINDDNISNSLLPNAIFSGVSGFFEGSNFVRYSNPAIILWKRQGGTFTWLAYKLMTYDVNNQNYVFNSSNLLNDWSNLQVRLVEAYPLNFTTGGPTPLLDGSVVVGGTSGARGQISGTPIMTAETWSSNTAAGTLTLTNISGTFQTGENLLVGGTTRAVVSGTLGAAKKNYIKVYYGDVTNHGTTNNIPTDNNRGSNPRIFTGSSDIIHWPVDNVSNWNASNDYMTLVQWDGSQGSATRLGGSGTTEANAIIQDASLLTPNSGTIDYSGIALHATGDTATATYFDDFAVQY